MPRNRPRNGWTHPRVAPNVDDPGYYQKVIEDFNADTLPICYPQTCSNCWHDGHALKDCAAGHVMSGSIPGCPVCNVPSPKRNSTYEEAHDFDNCREWKRPSAADDLRERGYYKRDHRFYYLIEARAGKPAIRSIKHFYLDVLMSVQSSFHEDFLNEPAANVLPWTDRFARERASFTHDENIGVRDPFWAKHTVNQVLCNYNINQSKFQHLRYFPPNKELIEYALKKALKESDRQVWSWKMVHLYGETQVFDRLMLPDEPAFGKVPPEAKALAEDHAQDGEGSADDNTSDATAPTQFGTYGVYRQLMVANFFDGTWTHTNMFSDADTDCKLTPSAAITAQAKEAVCDYLDGTIHPDSRIWSKGVWAQVWRRLFLQGKEDAGHGFELIDTLQSDRWWMLNRPLPESDDEGL